ncbi:hypothetical protein KKC00_00775 [Patescibacteria group bacterium]|nr:hypothetical protein [Patescibacteria group bacterium]
MPGKPHHHASSPDAGGLLTCVILRILQHDFRQDLPLVLSRRGFQPQVPAVEGAQTS